MTSTEHLVADLFFDPEPSQREAARRIYAAARDLPLVCPHGHVDPNLFASDDGSFGTPAELLIIPDHYLTRMLFSQGVPLESLGVPRMDGGPVEQDGRKIWQLFADHFYLFRGTPSGVWLSQELREVFGVHQKLTSANAQDIYDQLEACLASPEYAPRHLFERFNIEVMCTTDPAWDTLEAHQAIRASGWKGIIRPTFRPDGVVNLDTVGWHENIRKLSLASGMDIDSYGAFIQALELQRAFFKNMGAVATDHAALVPATQPLSKYDAVGIFQRALKNELSPEDAPRFTAHMLMEMARMSTEDGLVMQLHPGSLRNHNPAVALGFGPDKGTDIPLATEYTRNLLPLLQRFGTDPRLNLILFTLDETTYSRELAPLAGHYPALKLGPPWWFFDSPNGMRRYFDQVIETAGLYNTAGFNDDTRAFPSIPARHDVWRRVSANWLAGQLVQGIINEEDAFEMMNDLAVGLARKAYRLDSED